MSALNVSRSREALAGWVVSGSNNEQCRAPVAIIVQSPMTAEDGFIQPFPYRSPNFG